MFKKCMYIYLSLFFMNMHSMEDSVVQGHKLITLKMVPYMKTIADIVGDLGLDMVVKDTYLSGCKEWTQKPMFAPTLELLSQCIDVIKNKQVNSLEEEDWRSIRYVCKNISLNKLAEILQIVDFFGIDLLEDIIFENIHKSILNNPDLENIKYVLSSIPQDYNNKLRHSLYNYHIETISRIANNLKLLFKREREIKFLLMSIYKNVNITFLNDWEKAMQDIENMSPKGAIKTEPLIHIYNLMNDLIAENICEKCANIRDLEALPVEIKMLIIIPKCKFCCEQEIKKLQDNIVRFVIIIFAFDQANEPCKRIVSFYRYIMQIET